MRPTRVMMVAGESSGDLHGASLLEALRRLDANIEFFGMGGETLKKAGMHLLCHHRKVSVVGITEVISRLPIILRTLRELQRFLLLEKPDLLVLIDFPDFNLRLARYAHRIGIPVVYYVSPQVWAWRCGRVKQIAKWVRKMIVLFPFEVPIYAQAGVDVDWVGHPLVDLVRPERSRHELCQELGLDPLKSIVGLLPGSRELEIERLFPPLLRAAEVMKRHIQSLQFVVALAPAISRNLVNDYLKQARFDAAIAPHMTYDVMNASELLLTASGTATLEAAILGKPMIIVYRVSPLSYLIGRLLVRVRYIGLVNLVAGRGIVPELLQGDVNPNRIAQEALRILRDAKLREDMKKGMEEVRRLLGPPGAVDRAARIVINILERERKS